MSRKNILTKKTTEWIKTKIVSKNEELVKTKDLIMVGDSVVKSQDLISKIKQYLSNVSGIEDIKLVVFGSDNHTFDYFVRIYLSIDSPELVARLANMMTLDDVSNYSNKNFDITLTYLQYFVDRNPQLKLVDDWKHEAEIVQIPANSALYVEDEDGFLFIHNAVKPHYVGLFRYNSISIGKECVDLSEELYGVTSIFNGQNSFSEYYNQISSLEKRLDFVTNTKKIKKLNKQIENLKEDFDRFYTEIAYSDME